MVSGRGLVFLALGISTVAAVGCRRKLPDSEVKSVDAITTGDDAKRHLGDCGDAATQDRTAEAALDKVYARLPQKFRKQFPDLKAKIKLQDEADVAKECQQVASGDTRAEERSKNLSSCWKIDLGAASGSPLVPMIHMTRNRNLVHRDLLAMVTYAVLELYIDKVGVGLDKMDDAAKKSLTEELEKASPGTKLEDLSAFVEVVRSDRHALAGAVVDDLTAKKADDALANFRKMFSVSSNEDLKASVPASNFFFAEMLESYYCSDVSREAIAKQGLATAWTRMQAIAKYLDSP